MRTTEYTEAIGAKYPEAVAVAVSRDRENDRANIITLGWVMCTSHKPPMLAISVGHTRHSCKTIRESGEFVVAFPSSDQVEPTLFCGTKSGKNHDKFVESGFEALNPEALSTPLISGACANFECRLASECETGDHVIFVGRVVCSHMSDDGKSRIYTMADGSIKPISAG